MDPRLEQILRDLWSELSRGAADRHHGFHVPTLCTVGLDGAPAARSVVLRRVQPESCALHCHTDARSGKVAEIAREPRVAWHFYAPERKLQLRVTARAEFLQVGAVTDEAWATSPLSSRRCYLAPRAPGSGCDAPSPNLPEGILDRRPTEAESAPGRANFGVLVTHAESIDWLWLASDGHQRARFTCHRGPIELGDAGRVALRGAWRGAWIEP